MSVRKRVDVASTLAVLLVTVVGLAAVGAGAGRTAGLSGRESSSAVTPAPTS